MRKIFAILALLVMFAGFSCRPTPAEPIVQQEASELQSTIYWDLPGFISATVPISSTYPISATFSGTVQLRDSDGQVVGEQSFDSDCQPSETSKTGQCGTVSWSWDPAEYPRVSLEQWRRMCWQISVFSGPSCIVHVPDDCDLEGAGCRIDLDAEGEVGLPDSCMARLKECGTQRDASHFWLVGTFTGTKPYRLFLPVIAKGAAP